MREGTEAQRIRHIVTDELPDLIATYDEAGFAIDSYQMALAHLCGKYRLDPSYAAKLDELKHRSVRPER